MSKVRKISIITILLWCFLLGACYAATATIDVSAARLRAEANTTSNVLTNIYKGEKVEILEKNGEWYKVKYKSNVGYLKNNLIKEDSSKPVNETSKPTVPDTNTTVDTSKVTVNADVKVRFVPNLTSSAIMNATAGKEFTKLAEVGNWIQITDGLATGWVLKTKITTGNQTTVDSSNFENSQVENKVTENKVVENKVVENKVDKNQNKVTNITNKVSENKVSNNTTKPNKPATAVNKIGIVNVETAKVRASADKSAKVLGFLDYNDKITITAEEGEWYKFTEKDISGYVHKTLITIKNEEEISSRNLEEERKSEDTTVANPTINESVNSALQNENVSSKNGQSVADYAKQYLGYPYVVAGKNPSTGFDCSGFTRYVFLNYGYSLGATAASQNNIGRDVSRNELQPGDLLLFYDEGKTKIGHTGIYISNGDFVHAANPKRGVVTDNLNTSKYYSERFITAKRIVE